MSVVDIHPEELLDREAKGAPLAPEEQAMLRSHLERCAACRLDRLARADFARQIADGEKAARLSSMVALALRAAAPPAAQPLPASQATVGASSLAGASRSLEISAGNHPAPELLAPVAPRQGRGARARLVVALSFAAVMVAGVAAAGFSGALRIGSPEPRAPEAPQAAAPAVTASPRKAGQGRLAAQAAEPESHEAEASEPSPAAGAAEPPRAAASQAPSAPSSIAHESSSPRATEPSRGSSPKPEAAAVPAADKPAADKPASDKPSPEPQAAPSGDAASLFSSASDARAKGDDREAARLYQELVRRFPQSREAQVARALLGRMALDRGDGAQALEHFDGYLKSGDNALGEEAMVGRARTLERLGKRDEEAKAWAALLQAYPQSPHAAHARARLEALGQR